MKKCAMIGCGGIGQYHLDHLITYQDIELAGFCDLIPERAQAFAQKTGGKAFTDFRKLYDTVNPDMVFICVPPTEHGSIEFETLQRKIPFFVEKPVALDLSLAREIEAAIEEAQVITATGFQCRYSNLAEPTRTFIEQNKIAFIQCSRMGSVPAVPWWRDKTKSGGQIVEQTIHQFDLLRYVFGEPEVVFTLGARGFVSGIPGYNTDDLSVTAVRFENGALASIATGCYADDPAAFDSKITFSCHNARLDHYLLDRVDQYGQLPEKEQAEKGGLIFKGDGTLASSGTEAAHTVKDNGSAGQTCDRTFVDAVLSGDGSKIRSPYADAVKTLAFTLACNFSMETGQPVDLKNV